MGLPAFRGDGISVAVSAACWNAVHPASKQIVCALLEARAYPLAFSLDLLEGDCPKPCQPLCPFVSIDVHQFREAVSSHPRCAALADPLHLVSVSKTSLNPSVLPSYAFKSLSMDY